MVLRQMGARYIGAIPAQMGQEFGLQGGAIDLGARREQGVAVWSRHELVLLREEVEQVLFVGLEGVL